MKLPFARSMDLVGQPVWALGTSEPVRILLIDDDDDEAVLVRSLLSRVPDVRYALDWVSTFGEGLEAISRDAHQAYLIDQQLGAASGTDLVRTAREAGSRAALIMLTGEGQRVRDVAALRAGATDFLVKGRTDAVLLDRTLRYAITQAAALTALERSRNRLAGLEDLGQMLLDETSVSPVGARVAELMVDRFGFARVAVYLAEGETLVLAGHGGHGRSAPILDRNDACVDRVVRGGRPMFVPSMRSDLTASDDDAGRATGDGTELSVPLLVENELLGLVNVGSSAGKPIGEEDAAIIRLVCDRLTASLAVVRERDRASDRLRNARKDPVDPAAVVDDETSAFRRPLLEPLLNVAMAAIGHSDDRTAGLLLVACESGLASIQALDAHASAVFGDQPRVRFGETELALVLTASGDQDARAQAAELLAATTKAGLDAWCGYAGAGAGTTASQLVAAAQLAIAYARRSAAGTVIG